MTQGGSASPLRPIENGREHSGMSDPTVRPLAMAGVGRPSFNLDLFLSILPIGPIIGQLISHRLFWLRVYGGYRGMTIRIEWMKNGR
jgi:hypothetical protein